MFQTRPTNSRRAIELVVASIACLAQLGLAAILTGLAAGTLHGSSVWAAIVVAALLAYFVLMTLLVTVAFGFRSRPPIESAVLRWTPEAANAALSTTAAILALYTFCKVRVRPIQAESHAQNDHILATAGIALWTIGVIAQIAFHALRLAHHRAVDKERRTEPMVQPRSPPRNLTRSLSLQLKNLSPASRADSALGTPTHSPYVESTHSNRSSTRNSLSQIIRPITSRTRLILGGRSPSPTPRVPPIAAHHHAHNRNDSLEFGCRGDGFETWDTSAVDENLLTTFTHPQPPRAAKRLEPIPGSRPVSPAMALNGPFPLHSSGSLTPEDTPLPESPITDQPIPFPPLLHRESSFSSIASTTTGPGVEQSHIHPLFRTHSPTPPPLPSPGTVVMGSPYAGQVFGASEWDLLPRRLHSDSRSHSPVEGVGMGSRTASRAGSIKSLGGAGARRPSGLGNEVRVMEEGMPEMPVRRTDG
nr:hypothetical protein B0A51_06535 [Rachicladosporium sp. CCFEE 5018]